MLHLCKPVHGVVACMVMAERAFITRPMGFAGSLVFVIAMAMWCGGVDVRETSLSTFT